MQQTASHDGAMQQRVQGCCDPLASQTAGSSHAVNGITDLNSLDGRRSLRNIRTLSRANRREGGGEQSVLDSRLKLFVSRLHASQSMAQLPVTQSDAKISNATGMGLSLLQVIRE